MDKLEKVSWGIIGCGNVTEVKSGPAFDLIDNSKLVAVMRRNASLAEDYAKRHGVPKWYSDADDLINDPDINSVYIATPPNSHAEYAIKAAEKGKHVYVEKPMALNPDECMAMIEACEKNDVHLFVAYYRRALPKFLKVKELLTNGKIGDPLFVNIKLYHTPQKEDYDKGNLPWRVIPEISGGGYFVDLASHQFDLLNFLLGDYKDASGTTKNFLGLYEAEDFVSAQYEFKSGVVGTGTWFFGAIDGSEVDEIEIIGTSGTITFSTFDTTPVYLRNDSGLEKIESDFPENIQHPLIQSIVKTLTEGEDNPCNGIDGIVSNVILSKILKSD